MLTYRQREVLLFIDARTRETGIAPTYEEIAVGAGCSSRGNAHTVVQRLAERGYVATNRKGWPRSVEVLKLPPEPAPKIERPDIVRELLDALQSIYAKSTDTKSARTASLAIERAERLMKARK